MTRYIFSLGAVTALVVEMEGLMDASLPIRFVCATRANKDDFLENTALGRTLTVYKFMEFVQLRLFVQNSRGLPAVYNTAIKESANDPAILVFAHDDIYLPDFYWPDHIYNAFQHFDIVGAAGNKRRVPKQPSWAFIDDKFTWDSRTNLSGVVGHGYGFPCGKLSVFGPPAQEVKLLDGLMLACRSDMLHKKDLMFDERFAFHFYDMDFCRQAEQKGLKMGTWPMSVIHESGGNFGSESWKQGYQSYLEKWGS